MSLRVYNTLTRQKEDFQTVEPGKVRMYVCGPTVYKPSHVGHMVGPVIFDTVKRYLAYRGYQVNWVVNITDVDDKLIVRAKEQGTTVKDLATRMTADYLDCLKQLNVAGIDHMPKATEHIAGMIAIMKKLIDTGYAYAAGGDVYFDVSKDEDYGKLCNRDPEQLEAGARIEVSDRKRNPGDFALWKGHKPGEPDEVKWDSPWGPGRPGWHIECSAMSMKLLGETLDIHGGGLDLQFPHHENELAQSESCSGRPFARYWMHNGLLKMGKGKMAGSVGNVINVADALKKVSGEVLRFFLISTHYRSPIDLGDFDPKTQDLPPGLANAAKAYEAFTRIAERHRRVTGKSFDSLAAAVKASATPPAYSKPEFGELRQRFLDHMDDDFNTGGAVGVLFELLTALNRVADSGKLEDAAARDAAALAAFQEGAVLLKELGQVLGLSFAAAKAASGGDDKFVGDLMQLLIDLRAECRKAKQFPLADLIRTRLTQLGVTLEDRPGGTTWRRG
jgi:cysteinyl-tRNA synthetase